MILILSTEGISRLGHIKTQPSIGGRKCPKQVKQWKPCPAVPCYEWQTTVWSSCQLHVSETILCVFFYLFLWNLTGVFDFLKKGIPRPKM